MVAISRKPAENSPTVENLFSVQRADEPICAERIYNLYVGLVLSIKISRHLNLSHPLSSSLDPQQLAQLLGLGIPSRIPNRIPNRSPSRTPSRIPSRSPSRIPSRIPNRIPSRSTSRIP